MYKRIDGDTVHELKEGDSDIIRYLLDECETFYPEQYEALSEAYKSSMGNPRYYDFLRARRIVNCCFGENDRQPDIDEFGHYHFEHVKCPLVAECKYHKIICAPAFQSGLSRREMEVMELLFRGKSPGEVADKLFISIHTVNNHRKNALRRLSLHSMEEFINYAHQNKLFVK